jgi:hypothetical protein
MLSELLLLLRTHSRYEFLKSLEAPAMLWLSVKHQYIEQG